MLNKKLQLKTIFLNKSDKIKYFRIMDFSIPMLKDLNSRKYPLNAYYKLSDFKRLILFSNNDKEEVCHFYIEEKKLCKIEEIKGISEFDAFFEWIKTKGNSSKIIDFKNIIEQYLISLKTIRLYPVIMPPNKDIDSYTMQWIQSQMYIKEFHCFNLQQCDGTLKKLSFNNKFCQFVGSDISMKYKDRLTLTSVEIDL